MISHKKYEGPVTKELLLEQGGLFTWYFGQDFFIETPIGNFHWKDPDYDGDNTITLFDGDVVKFNTHMRGFGRDKGYHDIINYCGSEFTLVIPTKQPDKESLDG